MATYRIIGSSRCHHCHTCGTPLTHVLDGEDWCQKCRNYRRYRSHGWTYAYADEDPCIPMAKRLNA